jgi:hypothetical protein
MIINAVGGGERAVDVEHDQARHLRRSPMALFAGNNAEFTLERSAMVRQHLAVFRHGLIVRAALGPALAMVNPVVDFGERSAALPSAPGGGLPICTINRISRRPVWLFMPTPHWRTDILRFKAANWRAESEAINHLRRLAIGDLAPGSSRMPAHLPASAKPHSNALKSNAEQGKKTSRRPI